MRMTQLLKEGKSLRGNRYLKGEIRRIIKRALSIRRDQGLVVIPLLLNQKRNPGGKNHASTGQGMGGDGGQGVARERAAVGSGAV